MKNSPVRKLRSSADGASAARRVSVLAKPKYESISLAAASNYSIFYSDPIFLCFACLQIVSNGCSKVEDKLFRADNENVLKPFRFS